MTGLYIILAIVALLIFILFLPIRVYASYFDSVCVYLRICGISFPIYPSKKRRKALRKSQQKKKKSSDFAVSATTQQKKKGLTQHLQSFRLYLRVLKKIEERLRGAFKIEILEMYASVSTGDAASTAILYGAVSQGFSYILAITDAFLRTKYSVKNICVIPNYTGTDSEFKIKIKLSSCLFYLLRTAIYTFFVFNTEKTKEKNTVPTEDDKNG